VESLKRRKRNATRKEGTTQLRSTIQTIQKETRTDKIEIQKYRKDKRKEI
jgi:hypothetical protein